MKQEGKLAKNFTDDICCIFYLSAILCFPALRIFPISFLYYDFLNIVPVYSTCLKPAPIPSPFVSLSLYISLSPLSPLFRHLLHILHVSYSMLYCTAHFPQSLFIYYDFLNIVPVYSICLKPAPLYLLSSSLYLSLSPSSDICFIFYMLAILCHTVLRIFPPISFLYYDFPNIVPVSNLPLPSPFFSLSLYISLSPLLPTFASYSTC